MIDLKEIPQDKNLSIASCFWQAHKMLFGNFKGIIKETWFFSLVSALALGLFYVIYATVLTLDEGNIFILPGLIITLIISIASEILLFSRIISMLNLCSFKWNIIRVLIVAICFFILLGVSSAVTYGLFILLIRATVSLSLIALSTIVLDIVIMAFTLPFICVFIDYFLKTKNSFLGIPFKVYKQGLKYWGRLFVLKLISCLVTILLFLPMTMIVLAHAFSIYGVNFLSDSSGLPQGFIFLQFFTLTISWFIFMYVSAFFIFFIYALYSKIKLREEDELSQKV